MQAFKDPDLKRYFQKQSTSNRIARGFHLYIHDKVKPDDATTTTPIRNFLVGSSEGDQTYKVIFTNLGSPDFTAHCTCPDKTACKHAVAAAYWMEYGSKYIISAPVAERPKRMYKPITELPVPSNLISSKDVTTLALKAFLPDNLVAYCDFNEVIKNVKNTRFYIDLANHWPESMVFRIGGMADSNYHPTYVRMVFEKDSWASSCDCAKKIRNGICYHKLISLQYLFEQFGYFKPSDIPTKAQVLTIELAKYGFKPTDDYEKYLKVYFDTSGVEVSVKDNGLVAIEAAPSIVNILQESSALLLNQPTQDEEDKNSPSILYWLLGRKTWGLELLPIVCKVLKSGKASINGKKLSPDTLVDQFLKSDDKDKELLSMFNDLRQLTIASTNNTASGQLKLALHAAKMFAAIRHQGTLVMGDYDDYRTTVSSIIPITIAEEPPILRFAIKRDEPLFVLSANVMIEKRSNIIRQSQWYGHGAFLRDNTLHVITDPNLLVCTHVFSKLGALKTSSRAPIDDFFNTYVTPLSLKHAVETKGLDLPTSDNLLTQLQACLYIKDDVQDKLRFIPLFKYQFQDLEAEFTLGGSGKILVAQNNKIITNHRNLNWENGLVQGLRNIHPAFVDQTDGTSFWLTYNQAMADGWIAELGKEAETQGWTLLGQKDLKRFKFSLDKPTFELKVSSGIDWFDVIPILAYGSEVVPLKKIKQAILAGQDYVLLSNGTFGMLPTEWLRKLAPALRLGRESKSGVRISNYQSHMLADDSGEAGSGSGFGQSIDALITTQSAAYKQLADTSQVPSFELPLSLNATLRNYQQKGYNWLSYHYELGTGALLADDMGLGKTIQALALIAASLEVDSKAKHLIVMPTSLLFNWEQEILRFVPEVRFMKYYGPNRKQDNLTKAFKNIDVILTTYGTLRSDIELLEPIKFQMLVLDEAHAIKNPDAAISVAVRQIKAKFRLAMTGTPIENRTMDLFSQLDFLNPGLLGTRQSFNEHYANAIDKGKNEAIAAELRKLVSPFILRRTKQQVAQDLPPKTETILYTHLLPDQRALYNQVRDEIKANLVKAIREQGRNAAGILILSGLTKLRQICASAAILKPEMAKLPNHSAKLDLLIEELSNTTENYKVLVFSNFLGMLSLIADQLKASNIGYCYMDGSTTNRQAVVDNFKQDDTKRVFLMTLKTGGVGLNLTEAEYVYIIDPWWNPAAEQQAIDRTHRIGQSAPIFAYKLIAVDTIEEKIIELQQRKLKLATDLISTDEGVLGQLSDTEVIALFD